MMLQLNQNPYYDKDQTLKDAWDSGYVDKAELLVGHLAQAWKEGYLAKQEDLQKIPKGPYCYHGSAAPGDTNFCVCPFWSLKTISSGEYKGETYGYCSLLKIGDFAENSGDETSLCLFDQVKECSFNREDD